MQRTIIQIIGICATLVYGAFIVWLYAAQPQTIGDISTKAAVTVGAYRIDQQKFDAGVQQFHAENYQAARAFFEQADREKLDARTQFYIAYSFYRQGWGRVYSDDALFRQGLVQTNSVIALDADFKTDDADLKIKTPIELKTEFEKGLKRALTI